MLEKTPLATKPLFCCVRFLCVAMVVMLLLSPVTLAVSAADSNGNEFINNDDYARYTFSTDGTYVTADMDFPISWNYTSAFGQNWTPKIGEFSGSHFSLILMRNICVYCSTLLTGAMLALDQNLDFK